MSYVPMGRSDSTYRLRVEVLLTGRAGAVLRRLRALELRTVVALEAAGVNTFRDADATIARRGRRGAWHPVRRRMESSAIR